MIEVSPEEIEVFRESGPVVPMSEERSQVSAVSRARVLPGHHHPIRLRRPRPRQS